jgi:hypothetical protein
MSQQTSIKGIKTQTDQYHQDGLLDILAGLTVLLLGLSLFAGMPWLVAILPTTVFPIWGTTKRSLMAPRLGETVFASAQRAAAKSIKGILTGMTALGVVALLAGIIVFLGVESGQMPAWLREHFELGLGLFGAALLSATGLMIRLTRFQIYAVLTAAIFAAGNLSAGSWLDLQFPLLVALVGVMISVSGVGLLIRFALQHPVLNKN